MPVGRPIQCLGRYGPAAIYDKPTLPLQLRIVMGGFAFASGPNALATPRMPPAIYEGSKRRCHALLRELYTCVASPIQGPAKQDFGDIDIFLAWPKRPDLGGQAALDAIANALGAARRIVEGASMTKQQLAIPWPREPVTGAPLLSHGAMDGTAPQGTDAPARYIQVDIRICDSLDQLQWMLFRHAHGDMWNLLGTAIRPCGLTIDDVALSLRVAAIELFNRKQAKIFLSSEPAEILHFLGLPILGYWDEPFASAEDMFEYVARCRLFHVDANSARGFAAQQALQSKERRRLNSRPVYRKWIEEFLPKCRSQGRFTLLPRSRTELEEEALDLFHVRSHFAARRDQFLREKQRDDVRMLIQSSVPMPPSADESSMTYRSCLLKALKTVILDNDGSCYGMEPPNDLRDESDFFICENVAEFIARASDEIGQLAWARHQARVAVYRQKRANPD